MVSDAYQLRQIGVIRSELKDPHDCASQETEGRHKAWIEIDAEYSEGVEGLDAGAEILVLTWLHMADRSILKVHPRGNPKNPIRGVFATRSPHRPNPIGLHRTRVLSVGEHGTLEVQPLEVIDGTPVLDIKSVLSGDR